MNLHVRVIEANDIPKMDLFGKADPYCILKVSSSRTISKTRVKDKTYTPVWNEDFHFPIKDYTTEQLTITMKDKDLTDDDLISILKIQLCTLQINKVYDSWYDPVPAKDVKKGGRLHLLLHLAESSVLPFKDAPPPGRAAGAFGMAMNGMTMFGQNIMQMARNPMMGSVPQPQPQPYMQQPMMMQPQPYMQQPGMMQQQPYMQQPGMMQPQPYMQQPSMMQPQPYMQQPGMMQPQPYMQPGMMMPPPGQMQPGMMMPPPGQMQPGMMMPPPGQMSAQQQMQPGMMMPPPRQY